MLGTNKLIIEDKNGKIYLEWHIPEDFESIEIDEDFPFGECIKYSTM